MAAAATKTFLLLLLLHQLLLILLVLLFLGNSSSGQSDEDQFVPVFACNVAKTPELARFAFCNSSLQISERVEDLVKRLVLEEKIGLLVDKARPVTRLGIPSYMWWSEALHGVSFYGHGTNFSDLIPGATSFPLVILTSASFNVSLFYAIGKVVSTEARAMYNLGSAGLTYWSPNINIYRDPRWGRAQETPGEDPVLTSKYGSPYVRGLRETDDQGNPDRLKVAACCKHYTAYDLDSWKGVDRFHFNAQPTCADPDLLAGVIRGQWKLNGYIVSDCDSVDIFYNKQNYTTTPEAAAAKSILAGLDLDCGDFLGQHSEAAMRGGLLNESDIDRAISNNLATLFRLGFYDGDPTKQLYGELGPKNVCTTENQELAREAARQGIVLLKNIAASLPLSAITLKSLAVIGPNANATTAMIGNYEGVPCKYTTPLQGLSTLVPTVYSPGCSNVTCINAQLDDAKKIAAQADATVLVVGTDGSIENEGLDRIDLHLPGQQPFLVQEVAKASKGPVILIIMSGGSMDINFAKGDNKITSILWVGFPGEAGGGAIADVVFGFYNPSGRLPMTWYPQEFADKVPMTNMNMRPDPATGYPGRTYRFYTGETVYKFGDGLSYSSFSHQLVKAPMNVSIPLEEGHTCRSQKCESIEVLDGISCQKLVIDIQVRVENKGKMSGSHTVLMFSTPPAVHNSPKKQLLAFEKVFLRADMGKMVKFMVEVCSDLSVVDEVGRRKLVLGSHVIHVGDLKHTLEVGI